MNFCFLIYPGVAPLVSVLAAAFLGVAERLPDPLVLEWDGVSVLVPIDFGWGDRTGITLVPIMSAL